MLEVCVENLESAKNAIRAGANEIEICSSLCSGGLTPSSDLVVKLLALSKKLPSASRPKLNVMIRSHGGDDYCFTDYEINQMLCDMKSFKEMGIDGFVYGVLTAAAEVDETRSLQFLNAAAPNKVTFSHAFDHTREFKKSAAVIAGLGFHRLLTSGHRANVSEEGAIDNIAYLTSKYSHGFDQLVIMPGGGITSGNVATFINMGCQIVHSSCRSASELPEIERPFKLGDSDSDCIYFTDFDLVREMLEAIARAKCLKEEAEQMAQSN